MNTTRILRLIIRPITYINFIGAIHFKIKKKKHGLTLRIILDLLIRKFPAKKFVRQFYLILTSEAYGPDDIPIEFYSAIVSKTIPQDNSNYGYNFLHLPFNKIWDGDFHFSWNSASFLFLRRVIVIFLK